MTIAELLADLRAKGIVLWLEEEKLRYRAPQGALTSAIKSELTGRKREVIAFLQAEDRRGAASPPPIPPAPRGADLPLSFSEEGIWTVEQLRPAGASWNMQSALRLLGSLDIAALQSAVNALIRRQEILRTAYRAVDGQPRRVIAPELPLSLDVEPIAGADEMRRIMREEAKTPFDLATPPLFRIRLLRLSAAEHVFLFNKHHIISDAWSAKIFFSELFAFYEALAADRSPALADLPVQYSDYAFWLRGLRSSELESHFSYWQRQLDGFRVVELPSSRPRLNAPSYRGSKQRITFSPELCRTLRELGKHERATSFMILLASFNLLLYRYTGETDVIVGATVAGRNRSSLEQLIGVFINLLPLRTDLSGNPTLRETLRRVREVCLDGYRHQDYPFEKLAQQLSPARGLVRNSLFQVLFNIVNLPSLPGQVHDLTIEPMARSDDTARFDVTVFATDQREALEISAVYDSELFSPAAIREMLEQWRYLLQQISENPDRTIDDYSMLTPTGQSGLPNPTMPLADTWHGAVHEMLARNAQSTPDKPALEDPHEVWTYRELDERSNQLAQWLIARGLRREEVVAIYAHRSAALVWAMLGILKAGAAFCVIDPSHPAARVKEYLAAIDPKALIQIGGAGEPGAEMEKVLTGFAPLHRITLPALAKARVARFLSPYTTEAPAVNVGPDDLAYVIFTSGSTGKPKGVMGRHGPLTHFLPWVRDTFELSENDRFSQLAGLSSNILQREAFTALSLGATLCIPGNDGAASWDRMDEWLREKTTTIVHLTPAMIHMLGDVSQQSIPSVRRLFFAGDLLRARDVDSAQRLMPAADIVNFYNSSETQRAGGYQIFHRGEAIPFKDVPPLGRGIKDVQLLVLDRKGRLAGVGELGEIHVRSPHLARGYLGDPELTKSRFITNPFTGNHADRMYRTGEFGRFTPDGSVEFAARAQDQVSIRGFRVELGEIQAVLARHPAVQDAVIIAKEDAPGNNRLVAYAALKPDHAATTSEIRAFVKEQLPAYMIPSDFVLLASLPLNPSGKVDYRALPAPDPAHDQVAFVPPVTALEKVLAQSWAEILGGKRVGLQDNFFELGGHSLFAMQVIARIEHAFEVALPLRILYEAPTLADFAAALLRASNQPVRIEKTAQLLLQLADISEEQVESMLRAKASLNPPDAK